MIIFNYIFFNRHIYNYFFCQSCINNKPNNKQCHKCSPSILFKSIKIKSVDETLDEIIINKKSISRFGDGEFMLLFGKNIKFQKYNKILKDKLMNVLNSHIPNLLVGIVKLINPKDKFWGKWLERNKFKLAKIIDKNKSIITLVLLDFMLRRLIKKK